MNHPAPEVHEALAEVLAAHWQVSPAGRCFSSVTENCGWESQHPSPLTIEQQFRAHLASVLADHFAEAVTDDLITCPECGSTFGIEDPGERVDLDSLLTEARARELREAADRMPAFRDGDQYGSSNRAAIAWLRARADSLAPEAPSEADQGCGLPLCLRCYPNLGADVKPIDRNKKGSR